MVDEWVAFVSVVLVLFTNMGLMFSFGSVFPYILEEFQESRASTAAIQSIFVGVGRCTGLGYGFLFISAYQAVGQCFKGQARLIATAIGTTAVGIGSMVYPFFVDWLVTTYDLKGALLILGGIMLNAIPLSFTWSNSRQSEPSEVTCGICSTVVACLKHLPFIFVFFGIGLSLTAVTIFEILALDILESSGISREQSMAAYVAMQSAGVPARLVPGFMNKIPGCSSIMSPVIGSFFGGVGLLLLNHVTDFIGCLALFVVTGIARGIMVSCQSVVSLKMLGTGKYATGLGLILCLSGVCTGITGPLNGFLRDITGSYALSLYGAAATMFLSVLLCLISLKLHRRTKYHRKDDQTLAVFTITRL